MMSHVVEDLAGSGSGMSSSVSPIGAGDTFAEWVYDVYRGSQENVRCMMGYIVDLMVILNGTFSANSGSGYLSVSDLQAVMERHISSGHRDTIHRDIRSFVTEAFTIRLSVPQKDLVLEKIIDLITQFCVPPSGNG
ncbi:hypothetical protein B0F90DRAFT_1761004 [Multifurca ochricompacta]|uniref:Uncharacterized protein n=1 Tax=Multifurca ochricompacta TaxID=376703 RepID=A0AAD4LX93_9AGAM|nr:hypothetical protein B0F90DRAFT_1761004 [Multifurca ochricompacta]